MAHSRQCEVTRGNVLAHRADGFPGDDASPEGSLYENLELLPRDYPS